MNRPDDGTDTVVSDNLTLILALIAVFFSVVGVWMIIQSSMWGLDAASAYARSMSGPGGIGPGVPTSQFLNVAQAVQSSDRVLGGILFGVGLFHLLQRAPSMITAFIRFRSRD